MAAYYYIDQDGNRIGGYYDTEEEATAALAALPPATAALCVVGWIIVDYEPGTDPQQQP